MYKPLEYIMFVKHSEKKYARYVQKWETSSFSQSWVGVVKSRGATKSQGNDVAFIFIEMGYKQGCGARVRAGSLKVSVGS